jgi:hypothetical protein
MRARGRENSDARRKYAGIGLHVEVSTAKFLLRIEQAACYFLGQGVGKTILENGANSQVGTRRHDLLINLLRDRKCWFRGGFTSNFMALVVCAFYVTQAAKTPVIRLKKPLCGLEALAQPPRFVFSRLGQLTHRPKSQARGL